MIPNTDRGRHLYLIQMAVTGAIKIGRSNDPVRRLAQLQTGCPYLCRLVFVWKDLGHLERGVHERMTAHRTAGFPGEWFDEQAIGELPVDLYDQIDERALDLINSDWWSAG